MDNAVNCSVIVQADSLERNYTANSTFNSTDDVQCGPTQEPIWLGLPLIETDFYLSLVYLVIVSVLLMIGSTGNVIILIVTLTAKTVNRTGRPFIFNLALADLCVAIVADPMCILGVIKGERWFDGKFIFCSVVASMCLTACFCAFLSLTLLTMSRYVFVCHNEIYYKVFKKPFCICMCILCWIVAFLCEFPSFIGWGGHYFDRKNHQCIWDRTASLSYTLFVTICLIGGPLVLMALAYILIFRRIWQKKFDVAAIGSDDPNMIRHVWKEALSTSRTLLIVFFAFTICWTPYAIVTGIDVGNTFSTEVHLFVTLLAHSHSSLNCVIYTIMNGNFRKAVFGVVTGSSFRKSSSSSYPRTKRTEDTSTRSISETKTIHEKPSLQFTPLANCNMTLTPSSFPS